MGTIIAAWRILILNEEDSANAVPSIRNYVPKLPTFGVIAGVSPTEVQWKRPHPGGTTFRMTMFPVPGKYALSAFRTYPIISIHSIVWCVKVL